MLSCAIDWVKPVSLKQCFVVAMTWFLVTGCCREANAQKSYRPDDPIASVQGDPVLLGELNYLLMAKLRVNDLTQVSMQVQQASSELLVKRHIAMLALRTQGGSSLKDLLDREWARFESQLSQQGTTVDEYARRFRSVSPAVRASVDWDSAWRSYLRSRMTDANLKMYYQKHAERYAAARWDVSHLFIPVEEGADELAEQRMQAIVSKLEDVDEQARADLFAELARKESDGATAANGGKLGWVSGAGDLPPAVLEAVRQTPEGTISAVTKSPVGLHLVLVHEKRSMPTPYESLKDQAALRRDAANALFDALISRQADVKVFWYIKALQAKKPTPATVKTP